MKLRAKLKESYLAPPATWAVLSHHKPLITSISQNLDANFSSHLRALPLQPDCLQVLRGFHLKTYTRAHMCGAHDRFKTSLLATAERAASGERTPPV